MPSARATARTGDVVMGVRPEKVRLERASDTPNRNGDNMVGPGTVVDVSPGYLRNYLIPRKLAQPSTPAAIESGSATSISWTTGVGRPSAATSPATLSS